MVITADGTAPFQAVTSTNVAPGGPATVYLAPVGTALPADTVNMGINWAVSVAAWVPQGATQAGTSPTWTPTTTDLDIDESELPAAILMASADLSVSMVLAEDVIANIRTAFGVGSLATQAAGASLVGKTTFTPGTLLNSYALGMEMAINGQGTPHWRRWLIPNVVSVGTVAPVYSRVGQRLYACTFRANCLPSAIQVIDKTAESTS